MKVYDRVRIRQAEAAQLILLQALFTHRESRRFFFQGGTAISGGKNLLPHPTGLLSIFDVWYLTGTMGLKPDPEGLGRKLEMYRTPFRIHTPADFYAELNVLPQRERQGLIEAIRRDLARFIGVDLVETLGQNDFADLIAAVQQTFQEIVASKQVHLEA